MLASHPDLPSDIVQQFDFIARRVVHDTVLPLAQIQDQTDTGCYAVLWSLVLKPELHWVPICGVAVGDVTADKFFKYAVLAHEKAYRLSEHSDHVVSFQSRDESDHDPMKRKYPGAVRMDRLGVIVSVSGFAWQFDELACHLIGLAFKWLSGERLTQAIGVSHNQEARTFFEGTGLLID